MTRTIDTGYPLEDQIEYALDVDIYDGSFTIEYAYWKDTNQKLNQDEVNSLYEIIMQKYDAFDLMAMTSPF